MYGRYLNSTLAYIHFWITIVGAYLIFWPMHYEGLAGMPRRYYDFSMWESFKMFGGLNEFISFISMIVFAHNCYLYLTSSTASLKAGELPVTNPWGAKYIGVDYTNSSWSWKLGWRNS
jgi:cytochrome c oxidase subunit 1